MWKTIDYMWSLLLSGRVTRSNVYPGWKAGNAFWVCFFFFGGWCVFGSQQALPYGKYRNQNVNFIWLLLERLSSSFIRSNVFFFLLFLLINNYFLALDYIIL